MSDDTNTSNQDGKTTSAPTSDAGDGFKPITSQDELDRLVGKRIERERSKFSDYDDLKTKAARLDEIEEANKSELDKLRERAEAAEAARDQAMTEGLRYRIAAQYGISDDDAVLFLTGTDEDSLHAQAKRLADREADRKRDGAKSPNEGRTPPGPNADPADQFAEWAQGQFTR